VFKIQLLVEIVLLMAKEIFKLIRTSRSIDELEEQVQRLTQQATGKLLVGILEHIDLQLGSQRDPALKNVGRRSRTLVTSFGELCKVFTYVKLSAKVIEKAHPVVEILFIILQDGSDAEASTILKEGFHELETTHQKSCHRSPGRT
jgi:hypothetical protein